MKRFVIGDIHGRHKQLVRALQYAGVDYENDEVISLGDLVDRGPEPFECIFELMKIKHLVAIQGNHDLWLYDFMKGFHHFLGGTHGSGITLTKYRGLDVEQRNAALEFFSKQVHYHIDKDNRFFTHGGFDRWIAVAEQYPYVFCTDRHFFESVLSMQSDPPKKIACVDDFKEIYIGHTPTIIYRRNIQGRIEEGKGSYTPITTPINISSLWNMDTGAGFQVGAVTVMNIDTKEIFQAFIDDRDTRTIVEGD